MEQQCIQPHIFNSLLNNFSLAAIEQLDIDWEFTKFWLNNNPYESPHQSKLLRARSSRIEKCNFIYPTANILQRNYPRLYPTGSVPCSTSTDINEYVELCPSRHEKITTILNKFKPILFKHSQQSVTGLTFDLQQCIDNSPFFNDTFVTSFSKQHPIDLLIHNLVPPN
ncbi:hypothetical protein GLOIN_2v1763333 [Rhizophagus irregularis DAOM 181602=DAOM 197198]|uniref:Uncharacterized protein n=2 Tax=Rhizophagus irregularis TaxID=588596 RepID=A0A015ISQ2_RHIIW|nr:hypothetical protein RirG_181670 [Rhizophagus irregularis DAOM 197198w]GBC13728.1 hypothetical protein GLOIN_2v1763333 [Rhizophagus irregularis DAOM 181602=DAOM 197198]